MFQNKLLLFSLLLFHIALAYKIDVSCTNKGVEQDVRNAMTGAFEMVDASLRHLNANPYNSHVTDLIKKLFIAKNGQDPNDRTRIAKVKHILERIGEEYRNEVTGNVVPATDLIIFCDDSRYTQEGLEDEDKKKNLWIDSSNNEVSHYNERSCKGSAMDWVALAVTDNVEHEEEAGWNDVTDQMEYRYQDLHTQLTICPWFVDWIKNKEFRTGDDVARTNIGRSVIKLAESKNFGLKQIDAFSLLDKVLLHEMTHGRSVWDRIKARKRYQGTNDIPTPRNNFFMPIIQLPAYGWKWTRQLAQFGEDVIGQHIWNVNAADNNADSIALFGSAVRLLDHTWSRLVEDNGRIVPNV